MIIFGRSFRKAVGDCFFTKIFIPNIWEGYGESLEDALKT
jgi:hypothetical protein